MIEVERRVASADFPADGALAVVAVDDDPLLEIEEDSGATADAGPRWRILIVDDEQDVHAATAYALDGLSIFGRQLEFLHAYSARQAELMLEHEGHIAIVLLDVVMEHQSAGLDLVETIRHKLRLPDVRIILRTGQPGYAPEIETIQRYDINDYKTKSELTRAHLYATVATALRAYQQICALNDYAYFDRLCSLPNRHRYIASIDDCLADGSAGAALVALVDIDDFSEINDALGHQQGDRLLQAVAGRLASGLGETTLVARVGGDVFGLLGSAELMQPELLLELFQRPFRVQEHDMMVTATMGLLRLGDFSGSGSEALQEANIALKRAKSQQRGRYEYFSVEMGVAIRERVRLLQGLRAAFGSEDAMFLAYQPQVLLENGQAYGAEALLRWRTAEGRLVPPDRFIPLAEYSGLIVPIGEWVLRSACHEQLRLRSMGMAGFNVAVNVSLVQFRHPDFIPMLKAALAETGVDPACIELEITESMAVDDPDLVVGILRKIKDTGVSVAIDDFGTGYSSLSNLRKLPVDRLKIDRAFTMELNQSAHGDHIAALVIDLGRKFGLRVIAEGIEDAAQLAALRRLGCQEGQGYFYAKPMAAKELHHWVAERVGLAAAVAV